MFVVSRASRLIASLEEADCATLTLDKDCGETVVTNPGLPDRPAWQSMAR